MLNLAQHGIYADGTDLSEAMCRVAGEKAKKEGFDLNIFPANMTDFKSDRQYSCAIIARSGFMHLITPELQRAALINIRENLVDGGMLTFNTFDPHPVFQAQQMNTKDTPWGQVPCTFYELLLIILLQYLTPKLVEIKLFEVQFEGISNDNKRGYINSLG